MGLTQAPVQRVRRSPFRKWTEREIYRSLPTEPSVHRDSITSYINTES
jgi:hypothetical protein